MAKKFPKKLFVKIADGGTGPDYFEADDGVIGMVEVGEKSKIAIYQLVEVVTCEGLVKTSSTARGTR